MSATSRPVHPVPLRRTACATAVLAAALALSAGALPSPGARIPTTVAAGSASAAQPAARAPDGDAAYLDVADRLLGLLDARWSERHERYRPGRDGTETMVNANLLLVHAVAAQHGHVGPARDDRRARALVRWLTESSVWTRVPARTKQAHAPGWLGETGGRQQHLVIDAEVVDGLVHAHRARRELALTERAAARIRDRIGGVAAGSFWRWPTLRLNQFNWHMAVFAADAEVNGRRRTLAHGAGGHLRRFLRGVGRQGRAAGNLGPGMRFHYLPHERPEHPRNVDSAEYANIVLSFTRFYEQARAAGMPQPRARHLRMIRQWVRRAVAGYWTHGGPANWDSGFGLERWQQTKKLALMQQALIGVAAAEALQPSPAWGAWAKWLLDRSLGWFDAQAAAAGRLPDPVAFGIAGVAGSATANGALAAARIAGNAARAVAAGLGRAPAARPPALYAYDPDTGRLAVTTPAYSTAIMPVNGGAFAYGGVDLARLLDSRGRVAATIGGRPPAAFGLTVRDAAGRTVLASQHGRSTPGRTVSPLRLTRAPQGVGVPAQASRTRAYAGPFEELTAVGSARRGGLTATSRYRFTPDAIEGRWSLAGRRHAAVRVDALFPSWGDDGRVIIRLRSGEARRLGREPIPLADVAGLDVRGAGSGYRLAPLSRPAGATVRLVATRPQTWAPAPGPTAAVALPAHGRGAVAFAARIEPAA